jgi:hypothetical protein
MPCRKSLLGLCLAVLISAGIGCAARQLPPSEPTIAILQRAYNQMRANVASGQQGPIEARDQFYAKLSKVEPPLPGLEALMQYRRQIADELMAGQISPPQADARLQARESELLAGWAEMAAQYAAEQRRLGRIQADYERGFQLQEMPVAGRPQ